MYIHPGLTAVMKMLMKSNELKNPASEPENELKPVTDGQIAETSVTSESIEKIEEAIEEELTTEKPESEPIVALETIENEPSASVPVLTVAEPEPLIILAPKPKEKKKKAEAGTVSKKEPKAAKAVASEVEEAVVAEVVHEIESEAEEIILEPHPDHINEEDDPFHDDEPSADGKPIHDYSSYNKINLINTLRKIISEGEVDVIKPHADAIKACFYKIRNHEITEQKAAFVAEGHDEELFLPESDSFEQELKDLFREYKNLRYESNKKQEAVKEENYLKKTEIIEEIKTLVNSDNSLNNTFQLFNELQIKFKSLGQVPQSKVKDLWENYHYQVERFYDFIKIDRELRDLDLKRNMDQKLLLCARAEELADKMEDPLSTFKELQKLHESWREVGPVPREHKQELWDRFKIATSVINKRYQQHFEQERTVQKEQLQKKIELCEKAEELSGFVSDNPREWNDVTEKVILLQEEWKKTGFGPRKENSKIWDRFRAANDNFFQNKRNFWNKSKEHLLQNYALKVDICEQAERLKDSEEWKATTDRLITLQKKWKEVGPVPRKQSELIWKRFRTACDEFFNKKQTHFSGVTGDQDENLKAKKILLTDIDEFKPTGSAADDLSSLKKFQDRWAEIGHVPFRKKEELQNRYHDAIDNQFNKIKMDDQDLNLIKFKSKIEHLASVPRGWSKINTERDRFAVRLRQLESDINTLTNNVGFFGTSAGAQSLVQGVNDQIEKLKLQIDQLKSKMKIIDEQEEIN
jgi:hypothetical protein